MSAESYPSNLRGILAKLHTQWDAKEYHKIEADLADFFKHSDYIFLDCLDLIEFSKDKRKPDSLGSRIINKFIAFLSSKNIPFCITEEMKERVLDIASVSHSKLAARLISTFEVDKPSLELVRHHIKSLCENRGNLNAAISLATVLNLQNEFSIYELAVPVFMQNKLGLLEDYMQGSEKVQLDMIKLLNHWLSDHFNIISFCSEHGIRSMREEVLRPQFQEKMLAKWLKTYGKETQAEELCPNLCRRRNLGAMKYLLYRYCVEESTTFENTVELIKKTVGSNEWLQCKLIDILEHTYNDYEAADVFKKLFNMKQSHLQPVECCEGDDWGSAENWGGHSDNTRGTGISQPSKPTVKTIEKRKKEKYHCLKLPDDSIMMVSDALTLTNCIDAVLEQSDIVGIDAEWLFTRNFSEAHDIALLQLATRTHVYLLDMIILSSNATLQAIVVEFLKKLFFSQQHVKVGFGLREDLKKIYSSLPGVGGLLKQSCRVIDLNLVNKHVQRLYPQVLSVHGPDALPKQASGLSKMLQQTIGAKLDKSEQISDWERRPLRDAQIKYAALDAYCLIEIYDVLTARLKEIDANASLETILLQKPSTARIAKSGAIGRGRGRGRSLELKKLPSPLDQKQHPVMVPDFRVVCDNMLQGLGRQLRCCGIDTCILTNLDSHDKAAALARKEKRVILTSGAPFLSLSSQVPIGACLDMPNDLKAKEQLKVVLEHYNVTVRLCDIFSRCQLCNCGKYLKVLPIDMLKLYSIQPKASSPSQVPWEKFRKGLDLTEKNYTVVCSSDESDDDVLIVDGFDTKLKPIFDPVTNCTSPPKLQKDDTKNKSATKQNKVAASTSTSAGRTSLHINPNSFSNSSTLNLQTGEIVTINPVNGEKCCTPVLFKQVPKPICNLVAEFFCCIECGKVYWEGQHFGNVLSKFGDIISK